MPGKKTGKTPPRPPGVLPDYATASPPTDDPPPSPTIHPIPYGVLLRLRGFQQGIDGVNIALRLLEDERARFSAERDQTIQTLIAYLPRPAWQHDVQLDIDDGVIRCVPEAP